MWAKHKRQFGFTIVELLIVIVVIAILAAISIVAYNGIQARARASAASSALTQAQKKILIAMNDGTLSSYPINQAGFDTLNISSNGVSYEYSVQPSNPNGYCLTATAGNVSYRITESGQPLKDACNGHGSGGVTAITNLIRNPSAETNITDWEAVYGAGGAGTSSRVSSTGLFGSALGRMMWTTAPTSATTSGLWINSLGITPSAAGKTFTASAYVRPSWSGMTILVNAVPYSSTWSYGGGEVNGSTVTLSANTWTRVNATITAPTNTDYIRVRLRANGGTMPPVNATLDADGFMLTEGTNLYNYYDGNSAGWDWTSTANNSTSLGPPN